MLGLDSCKSTNEAYEYITPLIAKGKKHILYGEAGSGKTVSIIKHLNRHNIKPNVLDFDDNPPNFGKYELYDGVKCFNAYLNKQTNESQKEAKKLKDSRKTFNDVIFEHNGGSSLREESTPSNWLKAHGSIMQDKLKNKLGESLSDKIMCALSKVAQDCDNIEMRMKESSLIQFQGVVIVDTFGIAQYKYGDKVYKVFKKIISDGATLIIIAHTTEGGNLDMERVFSNNCNVVMRLNWDLSKNVDDRYLLVEKIRGYNGERKLLEWEWQDREKQRKVK